MTESQRKASKAFDAFAATYDHESSAWLDMGADATFIAGYLAALAEPAPEPVAWNGLTDVQWMNIVNLNHAWFGFSAEDVAHEVVRLTEARLKANNAARQKPVATIYITPDGEREVDDWKVPLPVGRNELYAAPVREPVPLLTEVLRALDDAAVLADFAECWIKDPAIEGSHRLKNGGVKFRLLAQDLRQKAGL